MSQAQEMFIGGRWTAAASGASYEHRGPTTNGGEPAAIAAATQVDACAAADAAAAAFPAWSGLGPGERRAVLLAAAGRLRARAEEIAATVSAEMGGTFGWGMFNVALAAQMIEEAGAQAYGLLGEVIPSDVPGLLAMGTRQPAGVVVGIAPWNAPVILGTRAIAMPLACGNTVILKASEATPRTHAAIVRAFEEAGAPPGVVNLVTNAPDDAGEVVEALIAHPAVRRINFTGSTRVGRIIAETAARHLKRVLLELGGKAPLIVLADADLDAAADAASFGGFMNSGQICMSTDRILVAGEIAEAFTERLADRARALTVGDPASAETQVGPMALPGAADRMAELVADATEHGASVAAGGEARDGCFPPTVLTGVSDRMRVDTEEIFGPIVTVRTFTDPEEAIRIANGTEYGLAGAVFGRDVGAALAVARRLETGICHVNGATVHDEAQMPFGGVKASGWGRFGSRAAIEEFTELRWITVSESPRHYPI